MLLIIVFLQTSFNAVGAYLGTTGVAFETTKINEVLKTLLNKTRLQDTNGQLEQRLKDELYEHAIHWFGVMSEVDHNGVLAMRLGEALNPYLETDITFKSIRPYISPRFGH